MGSSINAYNQGSCPDWMHNYLYESKKYGGSYEDNTVNETGDYNWDYWTMSAANSIDYSFAWHVARIGTLYSYYTGTSGTGYGARAVVVIAK